MNVPIDEFDDESWGSVGAVQCPCVIVSATSLPNRVPSPAQAFDHQSIADLQKQISDLQDLLAKSVKPNQSHVPLNDPG
jgi:hypothetical protein